MHPQGPKEDVDRKPVGGTKMEKDILARTMEQLRSGVIHKQVASGREFKGCPFNSKPKLIHFKVTREGRAPAAGAGVTGSGRLRGAVASECPIAKGERAGLVRPCRGGAVGARMYPALGPTLSSRPPSSPWGPQEAASCSDSCEPGTPHPAPPATEGQLWAGGPPHACQLGLPGARVTLAVPRTSTSAKCTRRG